MKRSSYIIIALSIISALQGRAQMSGDYSIGTSGTYTTFNAAVTALMAQDVSGAVVFNVESGTYNEQVLLPEITGASAINTITFQSASGDSTDVILTYAATDENFNYTLKLDGADFISFKNITLAATGVAYARIVEIGLRANSNTFSNNRLLGILNKSELVYSNSSQDSSNVFNKNIFQYGIKGINMKSGVFTETPGVTITENEFIDQTDKAIYLKWYEHPVILSNNIHSDYEYTGIQLESSRDKIEVRNNKILLPNGGVGIDLDFGQWINTNDTSQIYNNYIYLNAAIEGNPDYGIWLNNNYLGVKVLFNTVHIVGNNTSSSCFYKTYNGKFYLINNNLVNKAYGYAISFDGMGVLHSDFNNLFTQGTHITTYATDLIEWQTIHLRDINSISVDPYFITDSNYPVLNPALNGAGEPLAEVIYDIEGETRDVSFPDIGADEFTPAPIPMQGIFTIGGTLPDYPTINKAVEDLVINGVNGSVVFNIATDTYNGSIAIPEITGTSEINKVTFQSATGDSTDVIITHAPNTTYKHTIQLNGADHFVFKNLSITNTEEWGWPIELKSAATHNLFEGNKLFMASQPSKKDLYYSLVYARGSADGSNVFRGNYFENGSTGIYLECSGVSGTQIVNNIFSNMSDKGILLRDHISPIITGNIISISTTFDPPYGIWLLYISSNDENKGLIANNMITVNTSASKARGINIYNSSSLSILYNTIKVEAGGSDVYSNAFYGSGSDFDILNNIFVLNQGGFAASITDTTNCKIDYNLYPGSGGMYYSTGSTNNLTPFGFDLHSFNGDPVFASETDLHTTDPWISNRGTAIAEVTTDIDGQSRDPSKPDVGADEYIADILFAGHYTIGATGEFTTFTEAVDSIMQVGAIDSVTFFVQSGTYNEQFIIGEIPFVTDSITVTFKPEIPGDSTVILQFAATSSDDYIIKLDGADYITFKGFTFKALDPTYSKIIEFTNEATNNVIADNIFIGSASQGPIINSSGGNDNYNLLQGNRFYNGNYAIYMLGTSELTKETYLIIRNNSFENQFSGAIYLKFQSNLLVEANRVKHHNVIENNYSGIFILDSSIGNLINNEVLFNADRQSGGIVLSNSFNFNTNYNSVHIYGNAVDSRCFNQQSGGGNNTLFNNILANDAGGLVMYNTDITSFTSDYNNFYANENNYIYTDTWINDLTSWQSTYNKDQHSKNVNPRFASATDLRTTSPLLNGTALPIASITTDIIGVLRDVTTPDMGAYEFSNTEYVLGEDTTICKNTTIILDAGAGYDSYLWSGGATTQTLEVDTLGVESVWCRVKVSFNGTEYNDSLKVSYIGPTVDLPDTTGFCQGVSVQIAAGDGSDTYLWSTGSPDPSITVSIAGNYFVKVTDSQGCFERDTITVVESTGPAVDLGVDASFCAGDTVKLDAGTGNNYTYLWNDSSTDQILNATESGQYEITVADGFGCANSDEIVVTKNELPVVNLGDDITICEGLSTLLDAGSGFSSYLWSDQSQNQQLNVLVTGEYNVTVTNAFGCENSDTILVTVNQPASVIISNIGDEIHADYQSGSSYTWYINGNNLSTGNTYIFTPTISGEYYVEVIDENGCQAISNTLTVTVTSIDNNAGAGVFRVYPNPTNGHFAVVFAGQVSKADIYVINTGGKIVYQHIGNIKPVITKHDINLAGIPDGVYILHINVKGKVYNQKLLIE